MTAPVALPALRVKAAAVVQAGLLHEGATHPPGSPCIAVCQLDATQHHCTGCLRTLEELRLWGQADAAAQRHIWRAILARGGL